MVKTDIVGQTKHGLWGSNMKTGMYLPGDHLGQFFETFFYPKVIMVCEISLLQIIIFLNHEI